MEDSAQSFVSLHGLAKENKVEEMIRRLSSREKVDAKDKLRRTPLHLACFFGSYEAARLLIEYGANVNAMAQDRVRPIGFAVMKNQIEIVKLLLANGAASGISATFQKNDVTCLHIAAKNGSKEMVELLIQNRCNPNILSKTRKLASDEASTDEIRQLIENYRSNWKSEKKKSVDEKKRQRSTIRQRGEEDSSDEDSNQVRPSVQVERKVEETDATSLTPNAKRVKETPAEKTVPKKLDLKRLAFMLDDDDD